MPSNPVMSFTADLVTPHHLPGYSLVETIYQGARTTVYRAIETATQQSVVIKVLTQEYPSFSDLVQFRNQYTVAKNLPISGIIRPLCLESWGNGYGLIMEDFGGIDLGQYVQQHPLSLAETLDIAIQLADILHNLYQHQVIHKDIKPTNILIHPDSKQIKLIDFSIASLLPKETQAIQSPQNLEGTLAYMAPEQTGRMNRRIDYRTDFYNLGVTLYELLTGECPFQSDDPLELIHSHMAQQPISADQVNPEVPTMVAEIVAKLMAKNAEDRYQSTLGLKYDLKQCLTQWKQKGEITSFTLGQRDLSDRFLIPEKLYGRETEVRTLLDAFDRVAQGTSELILVAGFSGIGKTAVVNEVHKPITRRKGYFIKGKFDQFNRNIPFAAFVQAFRDLVAQLLSESDTELHQWKTQLLDTLGENAQVIIDLIPELERILGAQPTAPALSGTAAQNRFNLLFQKFIQVFTTPDHPLVIFVDDLQWADAASLNLIQVLMADTQTGHLLLLGAYRDNEVFPAHPLMLTQGEIGKTGAKLQTLTLQPLDNSSLNHLIADTLHVPTHGVQPLTTLVMQKTQGNPFFVTQFLNVLYQNQLITFTPETGHWQCNLAQVQATVLTEDVVELIASQLQKLPSDTQSILKLAACIGAQFDLELLAVVSKQSTKQVAAALWKALQEGLVLPTSQVYKVFQAAETLQVENTANPTYCFLHDRVQQAAYSLIADHQKPETHWHIGNLLWQHWIDRLEDKIFDLVNQLNMGQSAIAPSTPKQSLAKLNLQAAQKAKLSAAHNAAQTYCQTGINLLPTDAWQTDYELMYALHYHGAEAAYLSGDFDQAEVLYETALSQAKTSLEQAAIYRVQMTQYQFQGRNAEAIAIQRKSTQLLGWTLPTEPEQIRAELDREIAAVNQFLTQQTITSILDLPKMADAEIEEILRILQILFYAAWLDGQPTLALLALAKMTVLSLQYGNSTMSPFGYAGYGLIANAVLNDATQAHQFGSMAVQLCEQFDNADVRGMTNFMFAADVHSWKRPLREADQYFENAYKYSMDAGNWLTVSFTMMLSGSDRLTYGKNLEDLYSITQSHVAFLRKIKSFENLDALTVGVLQPIRQLLGLTASLTSFDDDNFSEADYLQTYQNTPYHLAWYYSVKIRHAYLFGQVESYLDLIPNLDIIESTIPTHAKHPSTVFYVVLMHLALIDQAIGDETLHWQAIQPLEDKLEQWRQDCPENIAHKCLLIQAEKARLTGQIATAIDCYEQSIVQAQTQGYDYEAALANELAAKFYLDWGKEKVAAGYMQEAYYGYAHWGAKAKVADLENHYIELLRPILQPSALLGDVLTTPAPKSSESFSSRNNSSSNNLNHTFDFTSILKAAQVLSSTLQLDDLLHQLTQIILQNSGGDGCTLVLPTEQGEWQVRASTIGEETHLYTKSLTNSLDFPVKLIQYVKNTQETIVIDDLKTDLPVIDHYLTQQKPRSVLCLPLLNQGNLIGIVYLNNQLTSDVFTHDRIQVLNFLCTQAAISLKNAFLFEARQRAEGDLQRKNSFLKAIQESSLNGMLVVDANRRVSFYNQRFVSIWDIPDYILATENDGQLLSYVLNQLENPTEFLAKVEYLYDHPEESSFDEIALKNQRFLERYSSPVILSSGKCDGRIWFFRDISDRKAAEQEILLKQNHLEALLNNIPHMAWIKDEESRFIGANQAVADLTGYSTVDIVGKTDYDILPEEVANAVRNDDLDVLQSEKRKVIEEQIPHADGTLSWLETIKTPFRNADGDLAGTVGIAIDITERKQAAAAILQKSQDLEKALGDLQNAQLKLVNSEKMSALGSLVSGVAHEINNPVGCIVGNVDIAQDYFNDLLGLLDSYCETFPQPGVDISNELQAIDLDFIREDLPKLIRAMKDAGNRIRSISQSLRTFSRADKTTKQPFDLRDGIESTLLILRHRLKANEHRPAIAVETEYGDTPEINCFPGQLNQVFMNILANAIDMFDEMSEQITFEDLEHNPQTITIQTVKLDEQVEIRIADNGTGMTDEVKSRIFDHLFTTKAVGKGTGLGLAIAQQSIAETHTGTLEVRSKVGEGTEFCICLPIN